VRRPDQGPVERDEVHPRQRHPDRGHQRQPQLPGLHRVFADGDPLKFPQICTLRSARPGAPTAINVQLRNTGGPGSGTWITRTITNMNAEAIDLRFIVQQLFTQTPTAFTSHGGHRNPDEAGRDHDLDQPVRFSNDNTTPPQSDGGYPIDSGAEPTR
jgi:hypothetical protein